MRTFLVACLAAAVIAICAVVVLNKFQRPVETAFATSAVRNSATTAELCRVTHHNTAGV